MFRLNSIYIKDYKSIHEQIFDISKNTGYIALIGLNGSGKSNLLEAISLIFQGLLNKKRIPFEYEIKYDIDNHHYERKKGVAKKDGIKVRDDEMKYPSPVIACYSGEDTRLWNLAYEDYYMRYFKGAIRNKSFTPQLVYINKYCWKIAFLSLLCSNKTNVKDFLRNTLAIDDITTVSVQFISDTNRREIFVNHKACKWFDTINQLQNEDSHKKINANVLASTDMMTYGASSPQAPDVLFQFLFLLSLPKKNAEKGQTIDKLITGINITIDGISFDNLSEGEKKLILIECITQVLGDGNALVLLDEPDAHVHIENKKKILETISQYGGQTILTTHSPIMANQIQKENKDNIVLLRKGKNIDTDGINKLEAISGEEIDFISSSVVVGSKFVLVVEGISDVRCLTKAIDVWSKKDVKYKKLESIKLLSAGGTGDVKEIFTDVLSPQIDYIEKIVFLFDIDDAGKKGYKKIEDLKNEDEYKAVSAKISAIYYNDNITRNYELEDLFPKEAYKFIVEDLHKLETYRDFKNNTKQTTSRIKDLIKEKASSFNDEWFDGFNHLLDRLINEFDF